MPTQARAWEWLEVAIGGDCQRRPGYKNYLTERMVRYGERRERKKKRRRKRKKKKRKGNKNK